MAGIAESLLAGLKLAPRLLFAVSVFGAGVLLMPAAFAEQFGIEVFRTAYRQWLGVATLAAFVLWLTHMILAAAGWISRKQSARGRRKATLAQLSNLSSEERLLLAYFVHCGAPTHNLVLNYAPARALECKGLLYGAPGRGNMFDWPYTIPAFVWEEVQVRREELFPELDSPQTRELMDSYPRHMRYRHLFAGR